MDIQQPDTSIKLPAEMQKAIEVARNNITMLLLEIKRLEGIKNTLKADVVTAEKTLSELNGKELKISEDVKDNVDKSITVQELTLSVVMVGG